MPPVRRYSAGRSLNSSGRSGRSLALRYLSGAPHRVCLRGCDTLGKQLLIHACRRNLEVLTSTLTGMGKPQTLAGRTASGVRRCGFFAPARATDGHFKVSARVSGL